MHFPTTLSTLSAFALISTSVVAAENTTFVTWSNPTCNGPEPGTHRYQDVPDDRPCALLPDARSIKVYYTGNSNCKVNTFSNANCTGDITSYKFEAYDAPCRLVNGKQSYDITC